MAALIVTLSIKPRNDGGCSGSTYVRIVVGRLRTSRCVKRLSHQQRAFEVMISTHQIAGAEGGARGGRVDDRPQSCFEPLHCASHYTTTQNTLNTYYFLLFFRFSISFSWVVFFLFAPFPPLIFLFSMFSCFF